MQFLVLVTWLFRSFILSLVGFAFYSQYTLCFLVSMLVFPTILHLCLLSLPKALVLQFCTTVVGINDPNSHLRMGVIYGGRKPRWMGIRALGSASHCGKEWLVDSTPRLNTHSLPPNTPCPQNRVLPGGSLGRWVRWRLLQGRWMVLTPLRPPGYHGTLLLPERKRATWSSQVFTKKLTQ